MNTITASAPKKRDKSELSSRQNNVRWFVNRTLTLGLYETAKAACLAAGVSTKAIHTSSRISDEGQMRTVEAAFSRLGYNPDVDYCTAPTALVLSTIRRKAII